MRDQRYEQTNNSVVKTFGMYTAVAFGTWRVIERYGRVYEDAMRAISKSLSGEQDTAFTPLFQSIDTSTLIDDYHEATFAGLAVPDDFDQAVHDMYDMPGVRSDAASFSHVDTVRVWDEHFSKQTDPSSSSFMSLDEPRISSLETAIDDINDALHRHHVLDVHVPSDTARPRTKWRAVNHDYPGIQALFNDMADYISVEDIRTVGDVHVIKVRDRQQGTVHRIELPEWRHAYIRVKGKPYQVLERLYTPGDIRAGSVHAIEFGSSVMQRVNQVMDTAFSSRTTNISTKQVEQNIRNAIYSTFQHNMSPHVGVGELVKDVLERSIGSQTFESAIDKHEMSFMSRRYVYEDIESNVQMWYDRAARRGLGHKLRLVQGKRIFYQGTSPEKPAFVDFHRNVQIEAVSEQAILKAKVAAEAPMMNFAYMSVIKQAQQRLDWMHGVPLSGLNGQRLTKKKLAATFGYVSSDVLDEAYLTQRETIPGRNANIAFRFEDPLLSPLGELDRLGDGGVSFVVREHKLAPGKLNISDWTGSSPDSKQVSLRSKFGGKTMYSTHFTKVVDALHRKIKAGESPVLTEDTFIGYEPGTNTKVVLKKGAIITGLYTDENVADISYVERRELQSSAKHTLGKAQQESILQPAEVSKLFHSMGVSSTTPEYGTMMSTIMQHGTAETGVEFIENASGLGKYKGGGVGLGLMGKTLNDVAFIRLTSLQKDIADLHDKGPISSVEIEKKIDQKISEVENDLMRVAEAHMGVQEAHSAIERITVDPETGVGLVWKPHVQATDPDLFHNLFEPEFALERGDFRAIEHWARRIERVARDVSGNKRYTVSQDMAHAYQSVTTRAEEVHALPTFITRGGKIDTLILRAPMIQHLTSGYPSMRFANHRRGLRGYGSGFRLTIDHIRNAHSKGLHSYANFLYHLMDYRFDYVENKLRSASTKFLTEHDLSFKVGPSGSDPKRVEITEGEFKGKKARIIDLNSPEHAGLAENLATDFIEREQLRSYGKYALTKDGANALMSQFTDPDIQNAVLGGNYLDLHSAIEHGVIGYRGVSVAVIREETMKGLYESIDSHGPDEVVLLQLPASYDIGRNGEFEKLYVPMYDCDMGDVYELMARSSNDSAWKTKHYTGNALFANRNEFLGYVSYIEQQMKNQVVGSKNYERMKADVQRSLDMYFSNLRSAFSGKNSPIKKVGIETSLPFSTTGYARTLDEQMLYGAMPTGSRLQAVGLHPDHLMRLISEDRYSSYGHALEYAKIADAFDASAARFTHLSSLVNSVSTLDEKQIAEAENIASALCTDLDIPVTQGMHQSRRIQRIERAIRKHQAAEEAAKKAAKAKKDGKAPKDGKKVVVPKAADKAKLVRRLKESRLQHLRFQISEAFRIDPAYYNARAYVRTIDDIMEGRYEITALIQRSPELPTAGMMASLHAVKDTGTSKETADLLAQRGFAVPEVPDSSHIYVERTLAYARGADFDRDPENLIITGLDSLDTRLRQHGAVTTFVNTMGYKKQQLRTMNLEAIGEMVEGFMAVRLPGKPGMLPASPSSLAAIKLIDRVEREEYLQVTSDITGILSDRLTAQGYYLDAPDVKEFVKNFTTKAHIRAEALWGSAEHELLVITGLRNEADVSKTAHGRISPTPRPLESRTARTIMTDHVKVAQQQADRFAELVNSMSPEQALVYKSIVESTKEDFAEYTREFRENVQRIHERKSGAALAYRPHEALMYLSDASIRDERTKLFVTTLADKALPQHALDAKHGVPLTVDDLIDRVNVLLNPTSPRSLSYLSEHYSMGSRDTDRYLGKIIPDKFFDDWAKGNLFVETLDPVVREMKTYGYIKKRTEAVSTEKYTSYLRDKVEYLTAISDAHREVVEQFMSQANAEHMAVHDVKRQYHNQVDTAVTARKVTGNRFFERQTRSIYYDQRIAHDALMHTASSLASMTKHMTPEGDIGVEAFAGKYFSREERKALLMNVFRGSQVYTEQHGYSIVDSPAHRAIRGMNPSASLIDQNVVGHNLFDVVATLRYQGVAAARDQSVMVVNNMLDRMIMRWTKKAYEPGCTISGRSARDAAVAIDKLASRERGISRSLSRRLSRTGDTMFKPTSFLDGISGSASRVAGIFSDTSAYQSVKKSRLGVLLAGLFTGALAGQSFNQATSGYAVPDLGRTQGLGGEYFEHTNGIMGRELEITMSPRPPRVTPWYSQDMSSDVMNDDVFAAYQYGKAVDRYQTRFRGVTVR